MVRKTESPGTSSYGFKKGVWNEDEYASIIPIPEYGWAILFWYKHRGKTDVFFV